MERSLYRIVALLMIFIFAIACSKEMTDMNSSHACREVSVEIVPLEKALQNLDAFLASSGMLQTKAGISREVSNVETHYSRWRVTKSGEAIPDAYIVNFTEENGFAVLGANTAVSPVVAVSYKGSLEAGFLEKNFTSDTLTCDVDGNEVDLSTFDFYSEEDDDYYVMAELNERISNVKSFMQEILLSGIENDNSGSPVPGGGNGSSWNNPPVPPVDDSDEDRRQFATVAPMLKTKWNQGDWNKVDAYNRFCYKYTLFGRKRYVLAGCSTTAMASIVAYNNYPTHLYVLNDEVDLTSIRLVENANGSMVAPESAVDVGLLIGGIFNSVNPMFVLKAGTCITAEQIKKCLQFFGYSDVQKLSAGNFNSSMKSATSRMLSEGKPVFLSAMHGLTGHSWVIDGAEYSGNTWMVDCDWGWSGLYNGYYSSDCFNPLGKAYNWHFRLITYSVPEHEMDVHIGF